MHQMAARRRNSGFTLAELLIALALLGIIAAFTIPKVIQATNAQEARAKLREAAAAIENPWYNLKYQNRVVAGQTFYQNIAPMMNVPRQSDPAITGTGFAPGPNVVSMPGAPLQGMWTHPCWTYGGGWMVFHNGTLVTFTHSIFNNNMSATLRDWPPPVNIMICIDINGAARPNRAGQDVFVGTFNQWGNFDAGGPVYQAGESNRSFFWGSPNQPVYETQGNPYTQALYPGEPLAVPEARVGFLITQ